MRLFLGISTLAAACMLAATGASARTLAFTSVTVLPMTKGEPVLRNQTVVVQDERIAAIGPSASVRVPRQAVRINGKGKYLIPGLADMHVHLEHFDNPAYLKLFLIHGVTTIRSMDGRREILEAKQQAAKGMLASPDIFSTGQVLDGSPPVRDDNIALATPDQARRAVEEQATAGYDAIKVYTNLAPEVFEAIVKAAGERGIPVVGHAPRAVGLDAFLTSGIKSIEHLGDFGDAIAAPSPPSGSLPAILKRRLGFPVDQARMDALARRLAASRVWVVPTMVTDERTLAPPSEVEQWAKDPEMATVDRGILEYWRGSLARVAQRVGDDDWPLVAQGRANQRALVQVFHRAGVSLMLGTDTPQPYVFPGSSVHEELANYVSAGLTPAQALALATREPARFMKQEKSWGTVGPGKRANLLLLEANPFEDIGATRRIAGMMIGGRWMTKAGLQEMRREVEQVAAASN